jgi:hypothetical protein
MKRRRNGRNARTDKPPMLLDPARQRDLLANLRARGRRQLDLRLVRAHAQDTPARGRRPDVDEQQLVLHELRHLRLLFVLRLDTQQTPQEEQADLQFYICMGSAFLRAAATRCSPV